MNGNATIGVLIHSRHDKETFADLYQEQLDNGSMILEMFTRNNILEQGKKLLARNVDAIMVRGGILYELTEHIDQVPIILMPLSANDIICALSEAHELYAKICLPLPHSTVFDFDECSSILDLNIERFVFQSISQVEKYIDQLEYRQDMAVVGGVVTTSLARQRGLNTVYASVRPASVRAAYQNALLLVEQRRSDNRRVRLMQSVLSSIEDGVIVVDSQGAVSHFNQSCEHMLGKTAAETLGRPLEECLPHNAVHPNSSAKKSGWIYTTRQGTLSLNRVEIGMDNGERQTLITLKDISKLQELEKNLRFQLNQKGLTAKYAFDDILTMDESMRILVERAKTYAATDDTVLIHGQSGTGKELFAQGIHNHSARRNQPFVAVNCAALAESLLESELFGYVEGAFTGARKGGKTGLFELAHGGTIFLDEINSLPFGLQSKILRVIEEKEIMRVGSDYIIPLDVRIIAAANADLRELVVSDAFRKDLFFRLNILDLHIPPLQARKKDIMYLFRHFVSARTGEQPDTVPIPVEMEHALLAHTWLGNIRELKSVANKYVLFKGDNRHGAILPPTARPAAVAGTAPTLDLRKINRHVEQLVIATLLEQGMAKTDIAALLGISRTALYNKMGKSG